MIAKKPGTNHVPGFFVVLQKIIRTMTTTFHVNETEINTHFLDALTLLFKNQNLTITVEADDDDATAQLLSSPANRDRLLRSIKNVETGVNLSDLDLDAFKALTADA